ncbi:redoxin domain-containing protein [Halonotius terrestris]|uniref:Redoxin domain-containing protein n=1 Tax=Halonotius terrestris TaxID=2487750 RepID=A0A8J8PAY3_9EURY|nr:redoxin domain-containing protein [Halonotius terrestris]TQQ83050.1 redoxin domain-containing protein [Halonotius terrestris]
MDLDFDIVDLPDTDHPTEGDEAPDFTRPLVSDEYWEDVSLSSLAEEDPVLLVFYPMDGAFPATYIWNELRDRDFEGSYEMTLVGLSISSPYEHNTFIDERGIDTRLFSDPQNGVAEAYDVVNDLDGMESVAEARPAVFLIDTDQTVLYSWVADEWPAFPPYDEVEEALAANCDMKPLQS